MQYVARVANSINVGRAGEFLVAAELEQRGIRCHRVDMQDDDLWVKSASGELLTMQVKATIEPRGDRNENRVICSHAQTEMRTYLRMWRWIYDCLYCAAHQAAKLYA